MAFLISKIFQILCDGIFAVIPRRPKVNKSVKIVAHRGSPTKGEKENTLSAFRKCVEAGIWGIEFDVRWTQDQVPVIHHDSHAGRIFGRKDIIISKIQSRELKNQLPELPLMSEVINEFAKKIHFMIELKEKPTEQQEEDLFQLLKNLQPIQDYHLLTLHTKYLGDLKRFPKECFVAVTELNSSSMWKSFFNNHWGGFATHYLFLSNKKIEEAKSQNRSLGVGYVYSKNSLIREMNRDIDWLFSNHALKIQKIFNSEI